MRTGARSAASSSGTKRAGRRLTVRGAGAVVVVGALATTLVGAQGPAAAESKVLQSVTVKLAADGTITGLTSKTLTVSDSSKTLTSTQALSPAELGDRLPIRVQASYQYGDRQGTNLADLAGKSGTFTINVTVTNTTVKPTTVQYDADGSSHTSYSLIGTPMTVLADADLGSSNLSQVLTSVPGQSGADEGTNGVVGTGTDGHTSVQWSAMLAPPRLSPTTTFTLVEHARKFVVPTFNISAQPGLVTDASTSGLIDSAFSSEPGSALATQQSTINTITDVNAALNDVFAQLGTIRSRLSGSADGLGAHTIANLQSQTADLANKLEVISANMKATSHDLAGGGAGGTLGDVSRSVATSLDNELAQIQSRVLGTAVTGPPATADVHGCTVPSLRGTVSATPTAYQLVGMVQGWLGTLSSASTACKTTVSAAIATAIGDASGPCPAVGASLLCTLNGVRSSVDSIESNLTTSITQTLNTLFKPDYFNQLAGNVDDVVTAFGGLSQSADNVAADFATTGQSAVDLKKDLDDLTGAMTQLQSDLGDIRVQPIIDALGGIHQTATDEQQSLASLPDFLPDLKTIVSNTSSCTNVGGLSSVTDLKGLLDFVPTNCTAGDATTALTDTISNAQAYVSAVETSTGHWKTVADATDPAIDGSVAQLVAGVDSAVTGLATDLGTAQTDLGTVSDDVGAIADGTGKHGSLAKTLAAVRAELGVGNDGSLTAGGLLGSIKGLYDATSPAPTCSAHGSPTAIGNKLLNDSKALSCQYDTITGAVGQALSDASTRFEKQTDGALSAAGTSVTTLSTSTQGELETLLAGFSESAAAGVADAGTAAQGSIGRAASTITTANTKAKSETKSQIDTAATTITGAFSAATGKVATANESLSKDFHTLLTALDGGASAHGAGGVVGVLNENARQTGSQADKLAAQSATTSAFNAVQGVSLQAIDQQKAEMSQALAAAANAKPFGISVPTPNVLTVYAFTIGGH